MSNKKSLDNAEAIEALGKSIDALCNRMADLEQINRTQGNQLERLEAQVRKPDHVGSEFGLPAAVKGARSTA